MRFENVHNTNRPTSFLMMILLIAISTTATSKSIAQSTASETPIELWSHVETTIGTYCLDCHDSGSAEGGIDLEQFENRDSVAGKLETWAKVLKVIEDKSMPPSDSDQPTNLEREQVARFVLASIAQSDASVSHGRLRRLTRIEYENTIRDLFRLSRNCFANPSRIVKTDDYFKPGGSSMPRYVFAVSFLYNSQARYSDLPGVGSLPVDPPVEHGFANDQEGLSLSPLQMEAYMATANELLSSKEFAQISGLWNSMFVVPSDFDPSQQTDYASAQLKLFLPRAFRRNVTDDEIKRYQRLFEDEFAGNGFTAAMKTTVTAILTSPSFLMRREFTRNDHQEASSLTREFNDNFALANRLSYFLWSTMPDDALFQAARERRLCRPAEMRKQVRRMLRDPRCKSLATEFGMQWLKVNKVASVRPDRNLFPEYYILQDKRPPVALSMMIEQLLLFETILIEDRSILDFLNADFAYLNRQLMDWYQLNPKQILNYTPEKDSFEDFFRVRWPVGHRGGVITSGATMMATSTTKRTSPVYRGAWIMDVIFNSPPPAPPANIPTLDETPATHEGLSVRQRLEKHREQPACAACHDQIDPLGFALENFDPVGRWRKTYNNGKPVDASTAFLDNQFSGAATLKNMIRREQKRFVRAFVGHVMKYALGRELHFSDEPEIRRIADEVIARECRIHFLIEEIVMSQAFRETTASKPMDQVQSLQSPVVSTENK